MADVIPAPIAIGKKALLIPCRFGSPNDTFDAPQVVFTPNSSRNYSYEIGFLVCLDDFGDFGENREYLITH